MSSSSVFSPRSKLALIAKKRLGGTVGVGLKRLIARPRYRQQLRIAREGFREHGSEYPKNVLYVAGMPKSGTTWLDGMLATIPGFSEVMLPEAVTHELKHHETLTFQLPSDTFQRLENSLTVLRLHASGSANNVQLLEKSQTPYIVLYRDLRDVAVSHHYYVSQTPWHPEFKKYSGKSVQDGLAIFARDLLDLHVEWIRSWRKQRDSALCLVVTYEQLKANPNATLVAVLEHYQIPNASNLAPKLVEANTFEKLSKGGKDSFFRKGAVGDWANHMTPDLAKLYADAIERAEG